MKRRGFFVGLLVAPFAAIVLLSRPATTHGWKWISTYGTGRFWPGTRITKNTIDQAFREALEAHERVMKATGMTEKQLLSKFREAVRVSTKMAVLEEVNGGVYDEFLEPGFKERIAARNYVYDPT